MAERRGLGSMGFVLADVLIISRQRPLAHGATVRPVTETASDATARSMPGSG